MEKHYCPSGCMTEFGAKWRHCPICGEELSQRKLPEIGDHVLADDGYPGEYYDCIVLEINHEKGSLYVEEPGLPKDSTYPAKRRWLNWWYDVDGNTHGIKRSGK